MSWTWATCPAKQKIQILQKETQQMNGDLLRLETVTSNSPSPDNSKPSMSRPTELITSLSGGHHGTLCGGVPVTSTVDVNKQLLENHYSSRQTAIWRHQQLTECADRHAQQQLPLLSAWDLLKLDPLVDHTPLIATLDEDWNAQQLFLANYYSCMRQYS